VALFGSRKSTTAGEYNNRRRFLALVVSEYLSMRSGQYDSYYQQQQGAQHDGGAGGNDGGQGPGHGPGGGFDDFDDEDLDDQGGDGPSDEFGDGLTNHSFAEYEKNEKKAEFNEEEDLKEFDGCKPDDLKRGREGDHEGDQGGASAKKPNVGSFFSNLGRSA